MMFFFLDGFILIGYRLTRSHLGRRAHLSVRSCLVVGAVVAPPLQHQPLGENSNV